MTTDDVKAQLKLLLAQSEANSTAKDVAGKAIGRHGLAYITLIVVIGVGASLYLDEAKIAAVIGLVSAALTALISMMSGIAEAEPRDEKAELAIIRQLIARLDQEPLRVDVDGDRVTVTKGGDEIATTKNRVERGDDDD